MPLPGEVQWVVIKESTSSPPHCDILSSSKMAIYFLLDLKSVLAFNSVLVLPFYSAFFVLYTFFVHFTDFSILFLMNLACFI